MKKYIVITEITPYDVAIQEYDTEIEAAKAYAIEIEHGREGQRITIAIITSQSLIK